MSFVKSFQLMERRYKERKTTMPSHYLFQIKLSNESAGRREADCSFRDLSRGCFRWQKQKLTVFPGCYKLHEQTSIPLEKKLCVQGGTHSAILVHNFLYILVHLLLGQHHSHPWHHLSTGYKASGMDLHTVTKLLFVLCPPFFIKQLFLVFTNCVSIHSYSWVVFHYSDT